MNREIVLNVRDTQEMRLYRVFCSTPGALESERIIFHDCVGDVNASAGPDPAALLVPVSVLPNMVNTTIFRPVLDENVRDCTFFLQVFAGDWGPVQRNFLPQFNLALQLLDEHREGVKDDERGSMREVAALVSRSSTASPEAESIRTALHSREQNFIAYGNSREFETLLKNVLEGWRKSIEPSALEHAPRS